MMVAQAFGQAFPRFSDSCCDTSLSTIEIVTANSDLPRPMNIHMYKTFPFWYNMGLNAQNAQINDVCQISVLTPPENDAASYSCPSAGVYNFHFSFTNPGSRHSMFAGWSGYSYGVNVHFKHDTEGGDWASCHMYVKVKKNSNDNLAKFVNIATLSIVGLVMGIFFRRRRQRLVAEDNNGEYDEKQGTNFELVQDRIV